jgi:sialic acid synthase SpsE
MRYDTSIYIGEREIALDQPTYFIADIASNHDGDLERAKALIHIAKESGADAVKFQHFLAKKIVSDRGFKTLGGQMAHQAAWKKSVYQMYEDCEFRRDWNAALAETAREAEVEFMTTPYDAEAVESVDHLVRAYKIGSGDITWPDFVGQVAKRGKPIILATGAAEMVDVERCVAAVLDRSRKLALLQCNTNYTGSLENYRSVNLNVLKAYATHWPNMVLGLSDHTPGHAAVLGAVTLGARIIEKHFTDDNSREGPDHPFSMNPRTWREMVDRTRELELALGDGVKRIEENERQSAIVQRRCLRLTRDMATGEVLTEKDVEALRPAPAGAAEPWRLSEIIGRKLAQAKVLGDAIMMNELE